MGIEIVRAHNTRAYPEEGIDSKLFIEIKIEGYPKCFGGLPVEWTRQDVLAFIEGDYERILREAQADAVEAEEALRNASVPREELLG